MASPPPGEDQFTHNLAIKLSRALNIVNPNDLLARRVQDIAKTNSIEGFISGRFRLRGVNTQAQSLIHSGKIIRQVQGFISS